MKKHALINQKDYSVGTCFNKGSIRWGHEVKGGRWRWRWRWRWHKSKALVGCWLPHAPRNLSPQSLQLCLQSTREPQNCIMWIQEKRQTGAEAIWLFHLRGRVSRILSQAGILLRLSIEPKRLEEVKTRRYRESNPVHLGNRKEYTPLYYHDLT